MLRQQEELLQVLPEPQLEQLVLPGLQEQLQVDSVLSEVMSLLLIVLLVAFIMSRSCSARETATLTPYVYTYIFNSMRRCGINRWSWDKMPLPKRLTINANTKITPSSSQRKKSLAFCLCYSDWTPNKNLVAISDQYFNMRSYKTADNYCWSSLTVLSTAI